MDKEKLKYGIYGIGILFFVILSVYPLSLLKQYSTFAFLYGVISWAMMFFITIYLCIWTKKMNEINRRLKES